MKITYTHQIVLFADVLGFSNLVYNKDQGSLESYFTYIIDDFRKYFPRNRYRYFLISDSIVVTCTSNKKNLSELIFVISKIQYQLFLKGILLRGGISYGDLYIDKRRNIIVGPGLINAYKLEAMAKYPRIIIDRKIIRTFFENTDAFLVEINATFKNRYNEDYEKVKFADKQDGWAYVNYLRKMARYGLTYRRPSMDQIIEVFKKNYFSNEHYEKYNWVLKEFIEELDLADEHYRNHPEFSKSRGRLARILILKEALEKL
jgi:hypothetical protein